MLEKLFIKNYLIIKEAEIIFTKGLNILTGETGAGKTIIIDALSLILGERADYSVIKDEKEKLVVEGIFNFSKNENITKFIKEKKLDYKESCGNIILRKELYKKGFSRNFINDTPVSNSDLQEFGNLIIDIHSQNEHQSLLKKETHIKILDEFIYNKDALNDYIKNYKEYKELADLYDNLLKKKEDLINKKSFIEFQLKEINDVNPQKGEDVQLENELNKLENTEEISSVLNSCIKKLFESETNIITMLSIIIKELKKVSKYDVKFENIIKETESHYISLKDMYNTLSDYNRSLNFDAIRIEQIRERLGALNYLMKKYNKKLDDLIDKASFLNEELRISENYDYEIEKLRAELNKKKEDLYNYSLALSNERKKAAKILQKSINLFLKNVGLESAEFKVKQNILESYKENTFTFKENNKFIVAKNNGIDDIEFLIMTNKGGDFAPLRKIASGGEISRIMLSIKAALSGKDNIPILVFDEIDAGISGRIADKVGKLLKELSKTHQIISITHLPQIASKGDNHLLVRKKETKKESEADIKILSNKEKIIEIAKLLSGENITETSLKSAEEMIDKS